MACPKGSMQCQEGLAAEDEGIRGRGRWLQTASRGRGRRWAKPTAAQALVKSHKSPS